MASPFTLSIVVPVYFNEAGLAHSVPALLALEPQIPGCRLELVFVNDGSGDRSLDVLLEFQRKNPGKIKIVSFTRNFGAVAAVEAGVRQATGDCVGAIAADLQDPPELFVEMAAHWRAGAKAVYAVRESRGDPVLTTFFARIYYRLLRRFALPDFPEGGFSLFLIDRQAVSAFAKMDERNGNILTQIFWLGFKPVYVPYHRRARAEGLSRWTFVKKVKFFTDTFVGHSYAPIRLATLAGIGAAALTFVYGVFRIGVWAWLGVEVKGFTTLALLITFIGGVQLMTLGIIGEYLWRTLDEARKRPPYVVERVFE